MTGGEGLDGRVQHEAIRDGLDPEQISTVDGRRYVDKAWRVS